MADFSLLMASSHLSFSGLAMASARFLGVFGRLLSSGALALSVRACATAASAAMRASVHGIGRPVLRAECRRTSHTSAAMRPGLDLVPILDANVAFLALMEGRCLWDGLLGFVVVSVGADGCSGLSTVGSADAVGWSAPAAAPLVPGCSGIAPPRGGAAGGGRRDVVVKWRVAVSPNVAWNVVR
jgi:hypothetical protein